MQGRLWGAEEDREPSNEAFSQAKQWAPSLMPDFPILPALFYNDSTLQQQ